MTDGALAVDEMQAALDHFRRRGQFQRYHEMLAMLVNAILPPQGVKPWKPQTAPAIEMLAHAAAVQAVWKWFAKEGIAT